MNMRSREQHLIDLIFEISLLISDTRGRTRSGHKNKLYKKTTKEKATWIAEQLRACGFATYPCGGSWGVLKK